VDPLVSVPKQEGLLLILELPVSLMASIADRFRGHFQ